MKGNFVRFHNISELKLFGKNKGEDHIIASNVNGSETGWNRTFRMSSVE